MDDNSTHLVLKGCTSLYSAITELTRKKYPKLASEFFEQANILYPYGILTLSKIKNISSEESEKLFFIYIAELTQEYINEMNRNGEINGSYIKGSFLGDDLFFCNEITQYLQLVVLESLEKWRNCNKFIFFFNQHPFFGIFESLSHLSGFFGIFDSFFLGFFGIFDSFFIGFFGIFDSFFLGFFGINDPLLVSISSSINISIGVSTSLHFSESQKYTSPVILL